jgi:hypothetical protein
MLNENDVTTFETLKTYTPYMVVKLSDFTDGQPLVVKLKRVSMLALAKAGKIPNSLLSQASDLFSGSRNNKTNENKNALGEMYDICRIMAQSCLVSPTLEEIESVGLELTDEQLIAIFNVTQKGVKSLEPFRKEQKDNVNRGNVEPVQTAT